MKNTVRKINQRQILAAMFLVLIFTTGAAAFFITIIRAKNDGLNGLMNTKKWIDYQYTQMLGFRGPGWINKGYYINLNGLIADILGQRIVNGVIKMNNGHLTGFVEKEDFSRHENTIKKLKTFLDEKGIFFLYVQALYKVCKYDPQLPGEIKNYANENADEFLKLLLANEFNILDLREELRKEGMDHYNAFYKTDLHWKHETAFWANRKILEHLESEEIIKINDDRYLYLESYNIEIYKNLFLGNYGKRTGRYYGGLDDIRIILPKKTHENPLAGIIDENKYFDRAQLKKNYYHGEQYNWPYRVESFENTGAPVQKRVLLLADSFVNSMHFFMNMNVKMVEYINLSYYGEKLFQRIEEYSPDLVIMLYTPNMIGAQLNALAANMSE
jgi:hypothetical protein